MKPMHRMATASIAIAAMAVLTPGCNDSTESYQEPHAEVDHLRDGVEPLEGGPGDETSAEPGETPGPAQVERPRLVDDPPDLRPELTVALFDAVMADNEERAIELVKQGAPPNATNAQGVPVLFISAGGCLECEGALVELTRVLLEHGADASATIARGMQAIHWVGRAGASGRPGTHQTLDLLIQYGADINSPNADGVRAIDFAARIGNEEWVEYLISRGARH